MIRIQSVFFDQEERSLARFIRGLRQAIAFLRTREPSVEVTVGFGDCSAQAVLREEAVESIRSSLADVGCRSFDYTFFAENLGHGGGQNRLFSDRADADHVAVVNPDTCMSPCCLAALLAPMADQSIGITEARQVPLEHQKAYDSVTGDTSWASGACLLVRGALIDRIGFFDDMSFFLYCDDVDFSWRARLAGYRVVHEPTAVIFHDKTLSVNGTYVPSEIEKYYSGLASLLIAVKYSRQDIVTSRLVDLNGSPEDVHTHVVAEFRDRERTSRLPEPLDPNGSVAQFQTYAYANLRFDYRF